MQLVKQSATLPVGDRARLAVVADTHSQPHPRADALLRAYAPDAIVHAGDIGELDVLDRLRAIAPVHAVRGNIDTRAAALPDVLVLDVGALRILVIHIGVAGPRLRGDAAKLARTERATLVICGHSHVPFIGGERGLTVFNPGSVGPRRFTLPIVFGTLEVDCNCAPPFGGAARSGEARPFDGRVRFAHVDCETGGPWLPPA